MTIRRALAVWLVAAVAAVGCGGSAAGPAPASARAVPAAPVPASAAAVPVTAPRADRRVVFLGDSLTAGLGLPIEQAYPSLIQQRLEARGAGWSVVNAGVSGDTSAGGLRRLDWSMEGGAAIVVVALGGNDALRGLPTAELAKNLDAIVAGAVTRGARVVIAGMEAPPNNGPEYARAFHDVYPAVATAHHVTLLPFLLDGVAGDVALNQADGIHPNAEGARRVADTVWRTLEPVVRDAEAASTR
ncbi:MAG: arylesterase [Candidatus Binatia bacterium]